MHLIFFQMGFVVFVFLFFGPSRCKERGQNEEKYQVRGSRGICKGIFLKTRPVDWVLVELFYVFQNLILYLKPLCVFKSIFSAQYNLQGVCLPANKLTPQACMYWQTSPYPGVC